MKHLPYKLIKILILLSIILISMSCYSDPISQASSFILNQETLKQVGPLNWIVMFATIAFAFQPFLFLLIGKKGDRKWQKDMLDTQNRTANVLNNLENSLIILSENITLPKLGKQFCEIFLDNIFEAHRAKKIKWLRNHFKDYKKTTIIDICIEEKITKDKFLTISNKEVLQLNTLRTDYDKLGDRFLPLINWNKLIPSVVKIMLDFAMPFDARIEQVDELMEGYLSNIKIDLLKNKTGVH